MKKFCLLKYASCLLVLLLSCSTQAQKTADSLLRKLLGRWEVVAYSEQGVQVDKRAPALPQALAVYEHVRQQRAQQWYGHSDYEDLSRRENRAYQEWQERDSAIEVRRVAKAIAMPYYAVFFADSTLSLYNKDAATGRIYYPEARHYAYSPADKSLDVYQPGGYGIQWQAQILLLTDERLTLYLPEEAEVVELVKTAFSLP